MTPRQLVRVLAVWACALVAASIVLYYRVSVDRAASSGPYVVSVWRGGERVARAVAPDQSAAEHALEGETRERGAQRVIDQIADSAPIFGHAAWLLGSSVATNRDGVSVVYQGHTAYATPDDLHKLEAYEHAGRIGPLETVFGVDVDKLLGALAADLHANPDVLLREGSFRRFAVRSDAAYPRAASEEDVTAEAVKRSVQAAARYLVKNQRRDGAFRYEVNVMSGGNDESYNFPRHAGATYFLARAGNQLDDNSLKRAARRAGAYLKDRATLHCGAHACVGEGEQVDVGSSALALLAYVELAEGGATEFREPALDLAAFLRSQQRADGDFQHLYSITAQHPIDIQLEYYTGEASLALSRVHRLSDDVRDLDAARRALSFLVTRSGWFFGARYFYGAEHWTCQALEELWSLAPDRTALDFCLGWQVINRNLQIDAPPAPPEYDGGISRGPFMAPRLTPLASRMEAAVATLAVARKAGVSAQEITALEHQIKRGFAFLFRYQFTPGPTYLMPDPRAVTGGFPGSPVDQHVRIDYPQHAGGALLRYWEQLPH
ncbi:MAG: prenyltransferase/squalene oxidase repeat-containing protein [Polyangiaceae bacterium]